MADFKERPKPKPLLLEEIPPAVQAILNLRCPSPPPILNNSRIHTPIASKSMSSPVPVLTQSPPSSELGRVTVPAGGALLQTKSPESSFSPKVALPLPGSPAAAAPQALTASEWGLTTSLDYTNRPPEGSAHHKAPSVHAHFYVDEAEKPAKPVNRSRSGSGSAVSIEGPLSGKDERGRLREKLALPTISSSEQNANIDPRLPQDDGKLHVLFGVCGATLILKTKLIIAKLLEIYKPDKIAIQLIMTQAAENFITPETLQNLESIKKIRVWRDLDEWATWNTRTDPVLHIELRRWADVLVVCPLTANTLAKISLGLCDNLLTNVIRAWNTAYPILLAPAMASNAYNAVTTKRQLRLISEEMPWIEILKPVEKVMGSYGDIGMGGMMDWNEIVNKIVLKLGGYPEEEDEDDDKSNENAIDDDEDDDDKDEDDDDEDEDDDEDDDDSVESDSRPQTDEAARVEREVLKASNALGQVKVE